MPETDHPHRLCVELFARMSEYLDRELEPAMRQSVEQHLARCRACRACLATLQRTVELCRSAESLAMPEALSARLKKYFSDF